MRSAFRINNHFDRRTIMKTLSKRPMSTLLLALLTFGISMVIVAGQLAAQQPQSVCNCNVNACATTAPTPPTDPCADVFAIGCHCNAAVNGPWQVATGRARNCVRSDSGGCCPNGDSCWDDPDCVNTCNVATYNHIGCNIPTLAAPCGHCSGGV